MGKKARLRKTRELLDSENSNLAPTSGINIKIPAYIKKTIVFILLLIVFMLGAFLRVHNLYNVDNRSPDERVYTNQATIITAQGWGVAKQLVREHGANKMLWLYPPPTRIGYLYLLSGLMKTLKSTDVLVGSYISCAFSILGLGLIVLMGLRFFNLPITLYALLFMSVSPVDLAVARRTWQDAMVGCMGLLLIYLCCEIARSPRRIIWYPIFVIMGSYFMLVKESGAVIYGLCIIWIMWILLIKKKKFLEGLGFVALNALGAGLSIYALSCAIGGLPAAAEVLRHLKEGIPSNAYALEYQTGPWHIFIASFWAII